MLAVVGPLNNCQFAHRTKRTDNGFIVYQVVAFEKRKVQLTSKAK
jgi:hypothetical protein